MENKKHPSVNRQQPAHTKKEWKVIEPEMAKEYVIVNDGEENIYIGKNKEKAVKMCKAVNEYDENKRKADMHDELTNTVRDILESFYYMDGSCHIKKDSIIHKRLQLLLKQAEQK